MGRRLHRGPAQVDARLAVLEGHEVPDGARRGVVEAEGHGAKSTDPGVRSGSTLRGSRSDDDATAMAAMPSPRPVRPRPSVVVPETRTGPPTAALRRSCASAGGADPGPVADHLDAPVADAEPAVPVRAGAPRPEAGSAARPRTPATTPGRTVPNTEPRSPRPAADSSASQSACAATSASEWPASPVSPGQQQPGQPQAAPLGEGVDVGADPDEGHDRLRRHRRPSGGRGRPRP